MNPIAPRMVMPTTAVLGCVTQLMSLKWRNSNLTNETNNMTTLIYYTIDKGRAVWTGSSADALKKMNELGDKVKFAFEDIEIPDNITDLLGYAETLNDHYDHGCGKDMTTPVFYNSDDEEPTPHDGKCGHYYGEEQFWCDDCCELHDKAIELGQLL